MKWYFDLEYLIIIEQWNDFISLNNMFNLIIHLIILSLQRLGQCVKQFIIKLELIRFFRLEFLIKHNQLQL